MPDISMCNDYSCPKFDQCYRAQAAPNPYRQAYFVSSPKSMDGCQYFWPLEETNEREDTNGKERRLTDKSV